MNHQFHHFMTHNKTPPPKKKQQPKMFSKWKLEAIRLPASQSHLICPAAPSPACKPSLLFCCSSCCRGLAALPLPRPSPLWGLEQYGQHCACAFPGLQGRSSCCCWLAHWDPQCWAQCVQKKAAPSDQKHVSYNVCSTTISLYRSILAFRDILYNGFEE